MPAHCYYTFEYRSGYRFANCRVYKIQYSINQQQLHTQFCIAYTLIIMSAMNQQCREIKTDDANTPAMTMADGEKTHTHIHSCGRRAQNHNNVCVVFHRVALQQQANDPD